MQTTLATTQPEIYSMTGDMPFQITFNYKEDAVTSTIVNLIENNNPNINIETVHGILYLFDRTRFANQSPFPYFFDLPILTDNGLIMQKTDGILKRFIEPSEYSKHLLSYDPQKDHFILNQSIQVNPYKLEETNSNSQTNSIQNSKETWEEHEFRRNREKGGFYLKKIEQMLFEIGLNSINNISNDFIPDYLKTLPEIENTTKLPKPISINPSNIWRLQGMSQKHIDHVIMELEEAVYYTFWPFEK